MRIKKQFFFWDGRPRKIRRRSHIRDSHRFWTLYIPTTWISGVTCRSPISDSTTGIL